MNKHVKPDLDLTLTRFIKAPRAKIWNAFADPRAFEQWWLPAPYLCRVIEMDLKPGGAFVTEMSQDGKTFTPHINACFLDIEREKKIIFTNALLGGWRPAEHYYPTAITAIITLSDQDGGTEYAAHVMHKDAKDRGQHNDMGFLEGWGTVAAQLAKMVE
ncbi:MAG: SRPBCC domain-containing protein [Proteobacteria bacterium]|nr:SRPBCC domain-containing protein [Pseudomonadota bacterium]